jgi:hypothetical protein
MDDKVKKILELQEQGVPRKEIYKIMEYKKIDYLNRFMKRQGFILDGELYVINTEENSANIVRSEAPVKTSEEAKSNINIINKEEAPEDMINVIPEGFKENMINLVNQYDKLQEMINWFNTKDDIDNTNVIEVNTGIRIDLPDAPIKRTTIRVNEKVWNDFLDLADANSEFDKHSLLSMAIKEYVEKYKK